MKRIICACLALLLILTGCTSPAPILDLLPEENVTYGIYEFTFSVKQTSGVPTIPVRFNGISPIYFLFNSNLYELLRLCD